MSDGERLASAIQACRDAWGRLDEMAGVLSDCARLGELPISAAELAALEARLSRITAELERLAEQVTVEVEMQLPMDLLYATELEQTEAPQQVGGKP